MFNQSWRFAMADKKRKKEITGVIKKYLGSGALAGPAATGLVFGVPAALGIGLDLIMTGGLFSIGTFVLGGTGALFGVVFGTFSLDERVKQSQTNTAGQTLKSNGLVYRTLEKM